MTAIRFTVPTSGRTVIGHGPRPFFVRANNPSADRHFGSIDAARLYARSASIVGTIFIDYAPGCGHFIERVGQ